MLSFKQFYCGCHLQSSFFSFVRSPWPQLYSHVFSHLQYTFMISCWAIFTLVFTRAFGLVFWCCSYIRCHRILTKLLVSCPRVSPYQFSSIFPQLNFFSRSSQWQSWNLNIPVIIILQTENASWFVLSKELNQLGLQQKHWLIKYPLIYTDAH